MNSAVLSMDNTSEAKKYRRMKAESTMEPVESLKRNVLQLKDNVVDWDSLEKVKDATNKALDVHKNMYDSNISNLTNSLKSMLKEGVDGAIKSLEAGLKNVDAKFSSIDGKVLNLDNVVKTLEKKISDVASKIAEGITKAELSSKQQVDTLLRQLNETSKQLEIQKTQSNQLAQLVSIQTNQIKALEAKLNALDAKVYKKGELLQLGESFNLPDQPVVSGDQGVYKDAPLALTVCGAAVLHNIGYTDKKGHQLILDPDTHRILVYKGK